MNILTRLSFLLIFLGGISSCDSKKKNFIFNKDENRSVDNIAYAIGVKYGYGSKEFMFDDEAFLIFLKGIREGRNLKEAPSNLIKNKAKKIDVLVSLYRKKIAQKNKKIGEDRLKKLLESDPSLEKHKTGLVYRVIKPGLTRSDLKSSKVKLRYSIYSLIDDRVIEDNLLKDTLFPYKGMLKAWRIGLNICGEGCEIEIYSPSSLAYGNEGSRPTIEPGEYLRFKLIFSSISSL